MKTLKFKPHLIDQILKGSKKVTWRLFDDKDLKEGDIFFIINSDTREGVGKALIIEVKEKQLGEVDDVDLDGHEKWDNKEQMLESLKKYYGDKIDLDTMVKVVKFQLIKTND